MSSSESLRLVVRSAPMPDESLLGHLLALASVNHIPGVHSLARLVKLPRNFYSYPCDLSPLAALVGETPETLASMASWPTRRGRCRFGAFDLSTMQVDIFRPKLCPRCLKESGTCKRIWDLRCVVVCPEHGCWLIDRCESCRTRLSWNRPTIDRCGCGASLIQQATEEDRKSVV